MEKINYRAYPSLDIKTYLITKICEHFDITEKELFSRSRERHLADARAIYFYISHKVYKKTSVSIAEKFDRNHATILSACKKVEGLMDVDKNFKELVNKFI